MVCKIHLNHSEKLTDLDCINKQKLITLFDQIGKHHYTPIGVIFVISRIKHEQHSISLSNFLVQSMCIFFLISFKSMLHLFFIAILSRISYRRACMTAFLQQLINSNEKKIHFAWDNMWSCRHQHLKWSQNIVLYHRHILKKKKKLFKDKLQYGIWMSICHSKICLVSISCVFAH